MCNGDVLTPLECQISETIDGCDEGQSCHMLHLRLSDLLSRPLKRVVPRLRIHFYGHPGHPCVVFGPTVLANPEPPEVVAECIFYAHQAISQTI